MSEFDLIRKYFTAAPCAQRGEGITLGIGDDCALLALPAGEQLAISTETLVAGVHFADPCDSFLLGQRSLAVAVSDLAAMGAYPLAFTLALTIPTANIDWLQGYVHGLNVMAKSCNVGLVGGDTTRGSLSLTITVFGRVPTGQELTRSGARPGDLLCVGGTLGDASGALPLVLGQRTADIAIAQPLLAHYWSPQPQLALGLALRGKATSAIDISDGLLADCEHIAKASAVSLVVERQKLPLSYALIAFAGDDKAYMAALNGGDDYVLVFTVPPVELVALLASGWPVYVIGRVEVGHGGVTLLDAIGQDITPAVRGYQHFCETS
ncbi:thiamine-phosphate kinase [Candidatus Pseudomonas adelgestsugas]|uniref:Thiamine-monophosphate kinase n=1 Tax=Candidatus Pseudomonas adelgestsugas TaxID=1302376 RepID=A0ABX5R7P7_9PSED|nr:thiamine-phosphate kinase [Candidatus Pseudomonas adelgestsugas]QAX81669.1 Thiamine-monophosphate kinase [Candidatus Pseudomonas adelgestsugas]